MKTIVIAAFFLLFGICSAQESQTEKIEVYVLNASETYELDNQVFIFNPELNVIRIKKVENKKEIEFGKLQKTTEDGLYIMTSIHDEDVSFGRFDSIGNFKTNRYVPETDTLLKEYYKRTQKSSKK